jgi:hypothetical protein
MARENDNHPLTNGTYDWDERSPTTTFYGFIVVDGENTVHRFASADAGEAFRQLGKTLSHLREQKLPILSLQMGTLVCLPAEVERRLKGAAFEDDSNDWMRFPTRK